MICSQFTGMSALPSMRMVPSVTKPSMRGSSGLLSAGPI